MLDLHDFTAPHPAIVREVAAHIIKAATGSPTKENRSLISQIMAEMGRKGGQKGGKRRLETMTQEERSQIALKAAQARWKKAKNES